MFIETRKTAFCAMLLVTSLAFSIQLAFGQENQANRSQSRRGSETTKVVQGSADRERNSSNQAQGSADLAKNQADQAPQIANTNYESSDSRDDFEETGDTTVNFNANSAILTDWAKTKLNLFAANAASAKDYVIEIRAYASAEGGKDHNQRLSRERAQAVMDYLIDAGKIPPRHIISPYSGGESNPVMDNNTRAGRFENRRAEVKLLVNKGLASKGPVVSSKP